MKPESTAEALENFHKACVVFGKALLEALEETYLRELVHIWSNDLQMWTGHWWWMDEAYL